MTQSPIQGQRTRLRAIERDDLPRFVRWFNDPETRGYLAMRYPLSLVEEEQWLEKLATRDDYVFAIEAEDGTHIGNIGLHDIQAENRCAVLGIIIGEKDHWDRGYGTDAIRAVLQWAFDYVNLHRVMLRVHEHNPRAIRCYEKCGFQHEGRLRESCFRGGQYYDELIMGILRHEFAAWRASASDGPNLQAVNRLHPAKETGR